MSTNLSSANTATVRVGTNAVIIAAFVWLIERFTHSNIDTTDPLFIAAAGVVISVGYRASRALTDRFPILGHVLFGIDQKPAYPPPPPQ